MLLQCHDLSIHLTRVVDVITQLHAYHPLHNFILSPGTRFVLTFELHDSSLNGFLETAILSSSSPPRISCMSRLYVPEDGSVCNSLSWCLIFSSANIMHRLSWFSLLSSESSSHSSRSPDNFPSPVSSSSVNMDHSRTLDLVPGV